MVGSCLAWPGGERFLFDPTCALTRRGQDCDRPSSVEERTIIFFFGIRPRPRIRQPGREKFYAAGQGRTAPPPAP